MILLTVYISILASYIVKYNLDDCWNKSSLVFVPGGKFVQ